MLLAQGGAGIRQADVDKQADGQGVVACEGVACEGVACEGVAGDGEYAAVQLAAGCRALGPVGLEVEEGAVGLLGERVFLGSVIMLAT